MASPIRTNVSLPARVLLAQVIVERDGARLEQEQDDGFTGLEEALVIALLDPFVRHELLADRPDVESPTDAVERSSALRSIRSPKASSRSRRSRPTASR